MQKVCGTLDHCFFMTQYLQWGDLQIYYCVIFRETRHHTQAHVTSGALIHCTLSLDARWTQTEGEFGGWFHWPCWLWRLHSRATFVAAILGLSTNLEVGWSWLVPAFSIKFLTRKSLKSRWIYLAPHEDNRIQLLKTVRSRRCKNSFVVHLKIRQLIE